MPRLKRRPAPGRHRDRAPRRGRHRLERPPRRRAGYAAAGLLAVTGAVTGALAAAPALRAADAGPVAIRPLAATTEHVVELAPRRPRRASRATARRPLGYRWVTRTVDGTVLTGRATWYGPGFHGNDTASGERFDSYGALTAAHRTLPFGTRLRVCRYDACVVVRVTDRGPYGDAILDLSWLAASRIGLVHPGIDHVTATVLVTKQVRVPA